MTAGFLMAVLAIVVSIVITVPEYAQPAAGAGNVPVASADPSPDASVRPSSAPALVPTSKLPTKLRGYRWPVRGGAVEKFYQRDSDGRFVVDGQRIHAGLVITWFDGATVKAAHKGTVIAAGRDWADHIGYDGSLDKVYKALKRQKQKPSLGVVIDDGNDYLSVYSELKDLEVNAGESVKPGQVIGHMSRAEKRQMMRYQLVRSDGPPMQVRDADRELGYPDYIRELVDPLVVFKLDAKSMPTLDKPSPPADPPRLSDY